MERVVTDVYEFEEIIGEGAFSNVVLATHNETGQKYAIKIIDKEKIQTEVQRERIDREIKILQQCNHPNVVKLVETFESDLEISLVLEWMSGGDLFERIASKGVLSEGEARACLYNMFSAVDYLHDLGVVHRDLKPENLLFSSDKGSAILKVADFGLAKYTTEAEALITPCGTIAYTAPEVAHNRVYRKVVDIWSCGCIMYFMLFGRPPFYSADEEEIYELVTEGSFHFPQSPTVSDSAKELIRFLLEKDPMRRYTSKQVLMHPWMTGRSVRPPKLSAESKPIPIQIQITPTTPTTTTERSANPVSMPLNIPNLRISLNSAIEAQRGPLTPPLTSPLESALWKKRAAKARAAAAAPLALVRVDIDLSSDSDAADSGADSDVDSSLHPRRTKDDRDQMDCDDVCGSTMEFESDTASDGN